MVTADLISEAERSLDQLLDWCCDDTRARPTGRSALFRFDVETPVGTRTRYVTVAEKGTVVVMNNNPPLPPNSTLMMSQEDLALLALGELSGSLAFTSGRLRVTGDAFLAMTWIDRLRKGPL